MISRSPALVLLTLSACSTASFGKGVAALPSPMLLAAGDQPALFIRPEPDAALIGYVADDVPLELAGAVEHGRVPVRVDGALRARGYVPEELLRLCVLRRGRVRGTPVYVGPGDRVRVLGGDPDPGRLRVQVTARLGERALGSYEGSYPSAGLSGRAPDASAQAPDPGAPYQVPARLAIDLFELPGGARSARLDAQEQPYEVRVLNTQEGWLAVRAGSGPYLIGWTNVALRPGPQLPGLATTQADANAAAPVGVAAHAAAPTRGTVPARLVHEPGELRRVAAHSKVTFGEQVIGVFKAEGWARVLAHYPSGYVDVFAAADDGLAIRGLMRTVDLLKAPPAPSAPEASSPPPESPWLPAAPTVPPAPTPAIDTTQIVAPARAEPRSGPGVSETSTPAGAR